jgi:tetratricopeptide (TPR) repeat protein
MMSPVSGLRSAAAGATRAWLGLVLLVALTAVTYRGVLENGFVWDDSLTVVNNHAIDSFASWERWFTSAEATSTLRESNYRPVLVVSYAVDHALWGRSPAGYHATNLAIHLGVVILVFALARRLWADHAAGLWAAGIVAVHPLNAEAINYVSARSSLLSALLMLSVIAINDTRRRAGAGGLRLGAALFLGLAALGVKETAVVLPLLIIAWDRAWWGTRETWRVTLVRSLPWWGLVTGALLARGVVLAATPTATPIGDGLWQGGLFTAKIFLASIAYWAAPVGLAIDHGWPWTIGLEEGGLLVAGSAAAAAATWWVGRYDRGMGWCLAWFWISLMPLAALPLVSRLTLYQDHRVYLAGVGLAWLMGRVLAVATRGVRWRSATGIVAALGVLVALGIAVRADAARTAVWRSADRLWEDVLAKYPDSVLGQNHRGIRALNAGRLDEARNALERSLRAAPRFPPTHNYLGILYAKAGDRDRAIAEFETAVDLNAYYAAARLNLGNAYEQQGRFDLALEAYERDLPDGSWARDTLERSAQLFEKQGRVADALDRYRRILVVEPDDPRAAQAIARLTAASATPKLHRTGDDP